MNYDPTFFFSMGGGLYSIVQAPELDAPLREKLFELGARCNHPYAIFLGRALGQDIALQIPEDLRGDLIEKIGEAVRRRCARRKVLREAQQAVAGEDIVGDLNSEFHGGFLLMWVPPEFVTPAPSPQGALDVAAREIA